MHLYANETLAKKEIGESSTRSRNSRSWYFREINTWFNKRIFAALKLAVELPALEEIDRSLNLLSQPVYSLP